MSRTSIAALVTVLGGIGAFVFVDILRSEERVATFETEPREVSPLEAINGTPFPRAKGQVVVTEPLAHVRLPFQRTLFGKHLIIRPRFHLDEGDVLEVGVKKTAFWLDYDRQPLAHRVLDNLPKRDAAPWSTRRSGNRVVYLNPRFENPWETVEAFEANPPTDGPIGLYGNAALESCETPDRRCETRPFRVTDIPDDFRAIYASYPEPDHFDPEWTENEQVFDLARAYQNDDGSLDVMFFVQARAERKIRVLFDEIRFRVEPGWPKPRDLALLARRNLVRLLRRPVPPAVR